MKTRAVFSIIFSASIFLIIALFQQDVFGAAGSLDPTFDFDGKVTISFGSGTDNARAIAIQSTGKIVVAGSTYNSRNYGFLLLRFNTDGSLDRLFGNNGIVISNFGFDECATDVVIQPDGKIVVSGISYPNNTFLVARYNSNGSIDSTFGDGGKVRATFGGAYNFSYAVCLQADGKIVVIGSSSVMGSLPNFTLARYNPDGSPDTTFDGDGKVITEIGNSHDYAHAGLIQADGKIVVAGHTSTTDDSTGFAIARYNSNGTLDRTFDRDGKQVVNFDEHAFGYAIAIQADGKILVAEYTLSGGNGDFAIARLNPNGSLDNSFGVDGKVTTDFTGVGQDSVESLVVQPGGKIIAVGSARFTPNYLSAIVRYNADGSLGATFGNGGKLTTKFTGGVWYVLGSKRHSGCG